MVGTDSASSTRALLNFFFTVTCACRDHDRCKRVLCVTSLPFFISGRELVRGQSYFVGGCSVALAITSVWYHFSHLPAVRAADVLVLWVTGITGFVLGMHGIWQHGVMLGFVAGLLGIAMLCSIFTCSYFYEDGDRHGKAVIKLPWHMFIHLIGAASLLCLASAFSQLDVVAVAADVQQARSMMTLGAAAAVSVVLVCGASVIHATTSRKGRETEAEPHSTLLTMPHDVCGSCGLRCMRRSERTRVTLL
jgi:hypothetical protein